MVVVAMLSCDEDVSVCGIVTTCLVAELGAADTTVTVFTGIMSDRSGGHNIFTGIIADRSGGHNIFTRIITDRSGGHNIFTRIIADGSGGHNIFTGIIADRSGGLRGGFNCIIADQSISYSNLGCILWVLPCFFGLAGSGFRVRKCISPQLKKKVTSNSLTENFYSKSLGFVSFSYLNKLT